MGGNHVSKKHHQSFSWCPVGRQNLDCFVSRLVHIAINYIREDMETPTFPSRMKRMVAPFCWSKSHCFYYEVDFVFCQVQRPKTAGSTCLLREWLVPKVRSLCLLFRRVCRPGCRWAVYLEKEWRSLTWRWLRIVTVQLDFLRFASDETTSLWTHQRAMLSTPGNCSCKPQSEYLPKQLSNLLWNSV